jgi:ArsR family transcriptional regulator, arsenate/arsenite/antimonite-responsive transcriptional repressor
MHNLGYIKNIYRVLGNATRLEIFNILMTGVHCNCEIAELTGLSDNLISHHLKVLQEANLIQSKRDENDARWIYYSVNEEEIKHVLDQTGNFFNLNRIVKKETACGPQNKIMEKNK